MIAARTSASSGLMTSSRSVSVFDGAICSSGTSSPVAGQPVLDQAVVGQLGEFLDADAGVAQHFHRGPGPERPVLLAGQVAASARCRGPRPRSGRWSRSSSPCGAASGPPAVNGSPGGVASRGGEQLRRCGRVRSSTQATSAGRTGSRSRVRWSIRDLRRDRPSCGRGRWRGSGRAPPTAPTGPGRRRPTGRCRGRTRGPRSARCARPAAARSPGPAGLPVGPVTWCGSWSSPAVSRPRRPRGAACSESMPGWWRSRSRQNSPPRQVGQVAAGWCSRRTAGVRAGSRPARRGPGGR